MQQYSTTRRAVLAAGAAALAGVSVGARAQAAYPSRPVTLIVPWSAGGATDRHLRLLADIASKHLGQSIVIENKPGVNGTMAPGAMALSAQPDGYTIAQFPQTMLRMPHMQKVTWHPLQDFTHIIGLSGYLFGLTVRADAPWKTFDDYIAAAREKPDQINYGTTGIGSTMHLAMEELSEKAQVKLNHVPFKSNAETTQAILGGHVMAQADGSGWDVHVESGKLRLLVTFGEKRTTRWPDVPTAQELGYGVVAASPYGLAGPKGMDAAVVRTLHDAFKQAMDDPRHKEVLAQLNQDIWYRSGADFADWAAQTWAREQALIQRLGLGVK